MIESTLTRAALTASSGFLRRAACRMRLKGSLVASVAIDRRAFVSGHDVQKSFEDDAFFGLAFGPQRMPVLLFAVAHDSNQVDVTLERIAFQVQVDADRARRHRRRAQHVDPPVADSQSL